MTMRGDCMGTKKCTTGYLKLLLTLLLLLLAAVAEAATVSGTVTNNTNSAGRVFLAGKWSGGGNGGWGKSVTVAANSSAAFTIRGVQDGTYFVDAFLDTQNSGIQYANDPFGTSSQFTVSGGANVTNVSVALSNPTPVVLQPPAGAQAVSGDGGVLVMWGPATDPNGRQIATSYVVYWSTSPNPGPTNTTGGGSSGDSLNLGDVDAYFKSFANGTQLYFAVTAKLGGAESAPVNVNGGASVIIGPAAGGVTVSGTVTTTGATLGAATPLYLALATSNGPPQYIGSIAAPSNNQAFSIAGVQQGNYAVYAILDMDNNGFFNLGDISNTDGDGVPVTVAGTPVTNANVTLAGGNATISVRTEHRLQNNNESYNLDLQVSANGKRPVNAAVSGPNLSAGTIDMAASTWGPLESWPNLTARPTLTPAPDTYSFAIEYSDGTTTGTSPLLLPVTGIVDSFATPVSPVGSVPYPFSGTYTWSAPASPPTPYTYNFWLNVPGFNDEGFFNMPSSTTSATYITSYVDGGNYSWEISVADSLGNKARREVGFTPTTSPVITGFTPLTGGPGTQVTITGFNFDGATAANNSVIFPGSASAAPVLSATPTQLVVTVPLNGTSASGPITVSVGANNGQSSGSFTVDATSPTTTANPPGGTQTVPINVFLTANEPATIYYTTNGADPTIASPSFTDSVGNVPKGPIAISSNTTLKYFARDVFGNAEAIKQQVYFYGTPTTLAIVVDNSAITYGQSVSATATVTPAAATGTVTFFVDGVQYGLPVTVSAGTAQMVVTGLTATTTSPHIIQAVYSGDATYAGSSQSTSVTVAKAAQTTPMAVTAPATATYGQTGLIVTASGGDGTGAFVFSAGASTACSVNSATGALTIVSGTGSCAITATRAADSNYLVSDPSTPASVTVSKAAATVILSNLSQQFDGTPKPVTVTTTPPGLAVNVTYNGSATVPSAIGSYAVTATITDANYDGSASGTLQIAAGLATVTIGNLSQVYDGTAKTVTVTTVPAGLAVDITYNGSATAPVSAGSYAVVATVNDPNYAGSASDTLVIAKALATVTLGNLNQTYTGSPLAATATTTPPGLTVNVTYNGLPTLPTSAGSYAVFGSINDANYQGSANGTLVIAKAAATVTLGNLNQTYTGSPLAATATTTPPGLTVNFTYNGFATATDAGSYAVVGTINDPNYQGSASGTMVIAKAAATVTLGSLSQTYTGTPRAATATTTPAGLAVNFTYDGLATAPVNAGSYVVVGTISDTNYQGSASGTLVIAKASQTITFNALPAKTYGDAAFALGATASSGLAISYASSDPTVATISGSTVTILKAGTTNITASQAGNGNYNAAAPVTRALTVNKATATVTLSNLTQTEDGSPKGVTITTTPANLAVNVTYSGSATVPATAGSYNVVATVNDTNYQGSANATLTILTYGDITGTSGQPDGSVDIVDAYNYLLMSLKLQQPPAYAGNLLLAPLVGGMPTPGTRTEVDVRDVSLVLQKVAGLW